MGSDDDMQAPMQETVHPTAESVILPSHQHTLESENRASSYFPIQFTNKFSGQERPEYVSIDMGSDDDMQAPLTEMMQILYRN